MNQTVSSLQSIGKWLEDEVLANIKLQQPEPDGMAQTYKLVKPAVHVGLIPPGHFLTNDSPEMIRIPCLVVGLAEASADAEATQMQLRITAVIYDPGHQSVADNALQLSANFDGYITLLNLLDKVRAHVAQGTFANNFELQSPIKLKTYEEQLWPYWYGYLEFTVSSEGYPQKSYTEFLE